MVPYCGCTWTRNQTIMCNLQIEKQQFPWEIRGNFNVVVCYTTKNIGYNICGERERERESGEESVKRLENSGKRENVVVFFFANENWKTGLDGFTVISLLAGWQ
jgi:hypothetical protein